MYTALTIAFIANIAWLATRQIKWDWLGVSAVEVGVVSCTGGLATGVLWGKPAWGIWWTWDARLTTAFLLWLLYIAYLLLRGLLEDPERRATLSAVFGIFAFLDAPLVYASNRLWRTQHPAPVIFGGQNSGLDPTMAQGAVGVHSCDVAGDDPAAGGSLPARADAARGGGTPAGGRGAGGRFEFRGYEEYGMKNFNFLFAAWMVVWAVFFVYEFSIASRMGRLTGRD